MEGGGGGGAAERVTIYAQSPAVGVLGTGVRDTGVRGAAARNSGVGGFWNGIELLISSQIIVRASTMRSEFAAHLFAMTTASTARRPAIADSVESAVFPSASAAEHVLMCCVVTCGSALTAHAPT